MLRLMVRLARIKLGIQSADVNFLNNSSTYIKSEFDHMRAELDMKKCDNRPLIRIAERVEHQSRNIDSKKFDRLVIAFGNSHRRNSFDVNFMNNYYNGVVSQIIDQPQNKCRGFLIAVRKDIEHFHKTAQECMLKKNPDSARSCKLLVFNKLRDYTTATNWDLTNDAFSIDGVHCVISENTFISTLTCYVDLKDLEVDQIDKFIRNLHIKGEANLVALYKELVGSPGVASSHDGWNRYLSDHTEPIRREMLHFLQQDRVESMIFPNEPIEIQKCLKAVADEYPA